MTDPTAAAPQPGGRPPDQPDSAAWHEAGAHRRADRTFAGATRASAIAVVLLMVLIVVFLISQAVHAISVNTVNWLTSFAWAPDATPSQWGIALVAWGTLVTSLFALVMGVPVAIGTALFITRYAPRRLTHVLGYIVDLLAAVPSVVYGLWGLLFLVPHMTGVSQVVSSVLGWIPIFAYSGAPNPQSCFAAGIVLAIMILPIVAAISREVFLQTPQEHIEAAQALGATRWETVRLAVLPYGRSGVISAVVLGFGRALGETIAVALVLATIPTFFTRFLDPGGNTIAANIATQFKDALSVGRGALIASGLVLFVMTLIVNYLARWIVRRSALAGSQVKVEPTAATMSAISTRTAEPDAEAIARGERGEPSEHPEVRDARARVHGVEFADVERARARLAATGHGAEGIGRISLGRRLRAADAALWVTLAFVIALLPLASILIMVVVRGSKVFGIAFLTHSLFGVYPLVPGGGAYYAILGTLEQVALASVLAVPLGVLTAIYLVEYSRGGVLRTAVNFVVDVLTGLPSVVSGLFILSLWILTLRIEPTGSGFAGSLALAILMIPIVVRSTEEMLKLVPKSLHEAAYALGVPKWRTLVKVVVPTALPGIVTGVMLAVARVFGETAPVLLVVGFTNSVNDNPFAGPQGSLPVFVYTQVTSAYPAAIDRAWAGALTLILLIMILNLLARLFAWWKKPGR
jgi:phosphate transport system permease protein